MLTKAELERQVKALKRQLSEASEGERGRADDKALELSELRQQNETLCTQLHEI